jgi:hypothetical protein
MNQTHARSRATGPVVLAFVAMVATAAMLILSGGLPAQGATGGVSADGGGNKWDTWWYGFSSGERRWARRVSECESGGNRYAHGGGGIYHGAFQYLKSTWNDAPKSPDGDPHWYRWRVQAVVSVFKKRRDGTGAWPVCG